jgi:hypothetical protein
MDSESSHTGIPEGKEGEEEEKDDAAYTTKPQNPKKKISRIAKNKKTPQIAYDSAARDILEACQLCRWLRSFSSAV